MRKFILRGLPVRPDHPVGHEHAPRGCGNCGYCDELDDFLTSASEVQRVFHYKGYRICEHIKSRLPSYIFECKMQFTKHDDGMDRCAFTVAKLHMNPDYQRELQAFHADLDTYLSQVEDFRTQEMKKFLGVDLYSKLVLLGRKEGERRPAKGGPTRAPKTFKGRSSFFLKGFRAAVLKHERRCWTW
ncbi:hypothetical protein F5Y16DRAFT_4056 [Xylariaceae sp. FL0255]|nr:hypothetical protein F5Y16DRAFT_4056 [Xylariaceae sp. FL0255]